jgi:hypothetical protein
MPFDSRNQQAQLVGLWGHCLSLEDGPEVIDREGQEVEHRYSISTEVPR